MSLYETAERFREADKAYNEAKDDRMIKPGTLYDMAVERLRAARAMATAIESERFGAL